MLFPREVVQWLACPAAGREAGRACLIATAVRYPSNAANCLRRIARTTARKLTCRSVMSAGAVCVSGRKSIVLATLLRVGISRDLTSTWKFLATVFDEGLDGCI